MPSYIKKDRLKSAIIRLSDWRGQVQSQKSTHLFPFLALIEKGVTYDTFTKYEESDDFDGGAHGRATTPVVEEGIA